MANIRNNHDDDDDGLPPPGLASPRHPPPSFHNLRVDTTAYHPPYTPGVSVSSEGLVNRRMRRSGAVSSLSSTSFICRTPPGLFDDHRHHPEERHFLDSCAMCNRPIGTNQDIFMYRGNIPFCSEECRQDRIDTHEVKGRKWSNLAAKAIMSTRNNNSSSSSNNQPVPINRPTGAVVAG